MTDVSNLDDLAAKINAKTSPNIRKYAVAQAAATQSQELEIQALKEEMAVLRGSGSGTRTPPGGAPVNVSLPTISGTAALAEVLSVSNGTWDNSPTAYYYQWRRCNTSGGACADITSATSQTYTVQAADIGSTIRCVVTASNASDPGRLQGGSASATTAATAVVTSSAGIVASFPADLATLHAAHPAGSTVIIPDGDNGDQTLTLNKAMTFVGESAAAVLGDVTFDPGSGGVELQDMTVGVVTVGPWQSSAPGETPPDPATNITLTNLDGSYWTIHWAEGITVNGGDWGSVANRCTIAPLQNWDGYNVPTDILIEGGLYHDFGPSSPSLHTVGILITGANGVTVRNAQFLRCGGTGDIGLYFVEAPTVSAAAFPALANIRVEGCDMSPYFSSDRDLDAWFNMQISNNPAIPGLVDPRNNTFRKLIPSNNPPYETTGINWFPRAVPGGTPKAPTPPTRWGRTVEPLTPAEFNLRAAVAGTTITDATVSGWGIVTAADVTLTNVTFTGGYNLEPTADRFSHDGGSAVAFYQYGAQNVSISNVDFDGGGVTDNCIIWGRDGKLPSVDITGCSFTRFHNDGDPLSHNQALYIGSSQRVVVDGCSFVDNGNTAHIFVTWFGGIIADPQYVCIRNNTFGVTHGAYFSVNIVDTIPLANVSVQPGQSTVASLVTPAAFEKACQ